MSVAVHTLRHHRQNRFDEAKLWTFGIRFPGRRQGFSSQVQPFAELAVSNEFPGDGSSFFLGQLTRQISSQYMVVDTHQISLRATI